MPNWKNRTMMMNSGGSVSRPTMADFLKQGYADLGSKESPSTYYNENRRSDRNIDDLRRLMQNQYYDKISSETGIGDIKEQVNKIENMKRKGRNLSQDLDYGPFSGSLSADGNSISARAKLGEGILDLVRDRDSGDNSASYRRGNYSLSGSESGRKSLDYEDGILYGSAFTGDERLGDGVRAGMRFSFSKGGPVQGFNTGGIASNSNSLDQERPFIDPFTNDPIDFSRLNDLQIDAIKNKRIEEDALNAKIEERKNQQIERFNTANAGGVQGYDLMSLVARRNALRNIDSNDSMQRKRAKEFFDNAGVSLEVVESFNGDMDKLTEYMDKLELENDVEKQRISEIERNIDDAQTVSTTTEEVAEAEPEVEPEVVPGNQEPAPEEQGDMTEFQKFATELLLRDEGSYSPEAERAGQVSSMYGQIAPGQVGGFGAAEARGVAAAEILQQKIDADNRTIGGALAKKRMELDAAPKYGTLTDFKLGKLGELDLVLQKYVSKTPGSRESLPAEGSPSMVVNEVYRGLKSAQDGIGKINWLIKNSDGATGTPATIKRFLEKASGLFGSGLPAGQQTSQKAVVEFLRLQYARDLLGEGGKTISDNERRMVAEALGEPGAFTTLAELQIKLNQVKDKLKGTVAEHDRFIRNAASEHPSIDAALKDYQVNVLGRQEDSQKPLVLNKKTGQYE